MDHFFEAGPARMFRVLSTVYLFHGRTMDILSVAKQVGAEKIDFQI